MAKKNRGIENLKSRYGMIFVTPWCIGLALFFVIPLFKSLYYSFSDVVFGATGLEITFEGLKNYKYIFAEEAEFTNNIADSLTSFAYSFPLIIIISLVLAIILNGDFKGRTFYRALYFTPVIIAGGTVITLLLTVTSTSAEALSNSNSVTAEIIEIGDVLNVLGLPSVISQYLGSAVNSIMNLLWKCGIQIVLFIAGMQSIPQLHYEVATVEGASAWETFWFVTIPELLRVIFLVCIFTIVEIMVDEGNKVMRGAYTYLQSQRYGIGNAMLWSYFAIISVILGIVFYSYIAANKKWSD